MATTKKLVGCCVPERFTLDRRGGGEIVRGQRSEGIEDPTVLPGLPGNWEQITRKKVHQFGFFGSYRIRGAIKALKRGVRKSNKVFDMDTISSSLKKETLREGENQSHRRRARPTNKKLHVLGWVVVESSGKGSE